LGGASNGSCGSTATTTGEGGRRTEETPTDAMRKTSTEWRYLSEHKEDWQKVLHGARFKI